MGFCNTAFIVSIQASVDWNQRGVATSSFMFMRIVGQSVGAAVFGAVLNFDLYRRAPEAGDLVNRVAEPGVTPRPRVARARIFARCDCVLAPPRFVLACVAAVVTLVLGLGIAGGAQSDAVFVRPQGRRLGGGYQRPGLRSQSAAGRDRRQAGDVDAVASGLGDQCQRVGTIAHAAQRPHESRARSTAAMRHHRRLPIVQAAATHPHRRATMSRR